VDFYHEMQIVNSGLLWKAVLVIIFSVILFLLGLGRYHAGIVTLIITLIIISVSIFFCVNTFILLTGAIETYSGLDLSSLNRYIERGTISYEYSTISYELGIFGYILFLLASVFLLVTVIRNAFTLQITETKGKDDK
jgi:hypothetical protein